MLKVKSVTKKLANVLIAKIQRKLKKVKTKNFYQKKKKKFSATAKRAIVKRITVNAIKKGKNVERNVLVLNVRTKKKKKKETAAF